MNISVFQIIAIVFFILAFIFLVITVVTFFNQDIASVIGFFSGKTEKKQVEQIRNQTVNINYGAKEKKSKNVVSSFVNQNSSIDVPVLGATAQANAHASKNLNRIPKVNANVQDIREVKPVADNGTVSLDSIKKNEFVSATDMLDKKVTLNADNQDDVPTDVLSDDIPTDLLNDDMPTDMLNSDIPTDVLDDDIPTDILSDDIPTDVLSDDIPTGVLNDDMDTTVLNSASVHMSEGFEIIEDVTFTDTNEVIK